MKRIFFKLHRVNGETELLPSLTSGLQDLLCRLAEIRAGHGVAIFRMRWPAVVAFPKILADQFPVCAQGISFTASNFRVGDPERLQELRPIFPDRFEVGRILGEANK